MCNLKQTLLDLIREEDGLTAAEYAIAGGLVGLGVLLAFTDLGEQAARIVKNLLTALQASG